MGKQINYLIEYEDFLSIAQVALDCGCVIVKRNNGKLLCGQDLDIITKDEHNYYFYIPTSEEQISEQYFFRCERITGYNALGNRVIEAGFSFQNDEEKELVRNRLFVISGFYDENEEYIPRPDCVTKIYNRLVRAVKKIAPYTELTDAYISRKDENYLQQKEWVHKEYISPQLLQLKIKQNYKICQ